MTRRVHSDVMCLVDGDAAGVGYVATLKQLPSPPKVVFAWPSDWTMESVLAWIAEANSAEALSKLGIALSAKFANSAALKIYLEAHKTYMPVHERTAEVLAGIAECRARTAQLLNDIADVARGATGSPKHLVEWPQQSTATTKVWQLNP